MNLLKNYYLVLIIFFAFKAQCQAPTKFITVDQFGYRTASEKIAVIPIIN